MIQLPTDGCVEPREIHAQPDSSPVLLWRDHYRRTPLRWFRDWSDDAVILQLLKLLTKRLSKGERDSPRSSDSVRYCVRLQHDLVLFTRHRTDDPVKHVRKLLRDVRPLLLLYLRWQDGSALPCFGLPWA